MMLLQALKTQAKHVSIIGNGLFQINLFNLVWTFDDQIETVPQNEDFGKIIGNDTLYLNPIKCNDLSQLPQIPDNYANIKHAVLSVLSVTVTIEELTELFPHETDNN